MTHEEYEQLMEVVNNAKLEIIKGNFEFGSEAYKITAHINRLIDMTVRGFIPIDYPIDSMVNKLGTLTDAGKRAIGTDTGDGGSVELTGAEEKLLRLIAEYPRYQQNNKAVADSLISNGFIHESNHDGRLYILKAGEQWLAEHPVGWGEANAATNGTVSGEYTVTAYHFFYEATAPDGRTIDGSTDKLYIEGLVDNLNTETAALRKERDSLNARLAECDHAHTEAGKQRDFATDRIDDLNLMVDEARRERDSLKALYDGKHERIEELKRELEVSREARKILAKQINDAAHYLGLSESDDEHSNRAYNILKGYSQAD